MKSGKALLALAVVLAGFFPGYFYYQAKQKDNFVTVKGLAEMDVKANLAVWNLRFTVTGNDLQTVQKEINTQAQTIISFLKGKGFSDAEITLQRLETNDLYTNPYRDTRLTQARYILNQVIMVRSDKVDLVNQTLGQSGDLVMKGIVFDSQTYGSPVSYIFTKLNDIKPQMLENATKNATAAAQEFAKASNSRVGKIRRAQQGVFSILPRDEVAGMSESQQIDKKIRVVSTIEFWLE